LDSQTQMKKVVADAAIREVKSDMILGLGSGSTAALMIKSLADEIRSGKLQNIRAVATSFQSEVLALELDIPLIDLASVSQIDLAIDGADEVDPGFQLIKGGGACHVREKLVASKSDQLLIVVDETKLVQNLNQSFPLPVEVLPNAWKQVQEVISEMNGNSNLSDDYRISLDEMQQITEDTLGVWEADDEDDLVEEITDDAGRCILSIDYEIQLK